MTQAQQSPRSSSSTRPGSRGPVSILLAAVLGLVFATILSWLFGTTVEIVGMTFFWREQGVRHSEQLAIDGIAHIAGHPRCAMAADTVQVAHNVAGAVLTPFVWIGAVTFIQKYSAPVDTASMSIIASKLQSLLYTLARWVLMSIYVAQDIAVRLVVMWFALPLFGMLFLLAIIDGLVRRDLRKWSGGRESSFVYHHAKKLTTWGLTGGFAIYLAWPFGGINPVAIVTALSLFSAAALTITVASFKKYL